MEYYFSEYACSHGRYTVLMVIEDGKSRMATLEEANRFMINQGAKVILKDVDG